MSVRFSVIRALGRGGMGHVELVREIATGEVLARKRLFRFDEARVNALKRELRLVGELVHPNLVRLYELGEDREGPFLLMEAVDGVDVVSYCGGGIGRELATVLPQLLSVLRFLHRQGLAHGDLSPANVRVRRDGCVKLLDFGLSAAFEREQGRARGGTPGYVAPERLEGSHPTPESDLYGLGAILHHIATGAPPGGERCASIEPAALGCALGALLSSAPHERPSIDALERDLVPALGAARGLRDSRATVTASRRPSPRASLEARVFGTLLARQGQLVALRGPSGIGKTTLATEVARHAEDAGLSVAWARARPEERVAFNLIGELVEDAGRRLRLGPIADEVRGAAQRASVSFPVLARLGGRESHEDKVRQRVRAELFGEGGAMPSSRASLFDDLRVLFEAADPTASKRLFVLDDLQWADGDSIAFLESLLGAAAARITLLATVRDEPGEAVKAWLASRHDVAFVDVPPLRDDEVVAHLEARGDFAPDVARRVAKACAGLPALVELALRSPESVDPLGDTVRSVVCDGERAEKEALAMLLVAGTPLTMEEPALSQRAVDRLAHRGLVACAGSQVSLLHDALREPLRHALGADWLRAAHASRADSLEAMTASDAERVHQLLGAGRADEAAALALVAADEARARKAFDLAADLYDVALRGARSPALLRARAETLEGARRFDEAASAWALLGADTPTGEARASVYLAEAHAHLSGRRITEGRALLERALLEQGEPGLGAGWLRRLRTTARFLLGPRPPWLGTPGTTARPKPHAIPSLPEAERFLRSAALVGYFDTIYGLELLLRAREAFMRGGDRERAAWCEFLLSFFARFAFIGGASLSRRYRRAAERCLRGRTVENPVVRSFPRFLTAYDALQASAFRQAAAHFDIALDGVAGTEEARSFEVQLTTSLRTSAVLATQDVNAAEAAVARFEALARDGVEVAIHCHVENARALLWTWRGRFEEAADSMARLRKSWPTEPETVQSTLIEIYGALPAVLLGDAARVRSRVRAACERARRLDLFGSAYGPIIAGVAAVTELAARRAGGADLAAARRFAELCIARPSVLTGLGYRALAALDELTGRPTKALAHLLRAEHEARRLGQAIDLAQALFARGRRSGSPELEVAARTELAAAGASPRLFVEYDLLRAYAAVP
jgi:hypothetical protein